MQVSQSTPSSSTPEMWMTSSPEIHVFQRHQSADHTEHWNASESEWDHSLAMDSLETAYSEGADEEYESYVDDVLHPRATLLGKTIFWTCSSLCTLAILAMALFHIWAHSQATRLGFVYSQESKQFARLKEERRLLKLRLAKLRSPNRLARIARQQLGMRLPERTHVISESHVVEKLNLSSRRRTKRQIQLAR